MQRSHPPDPVLLPTLPVPQAAPACCTACPWISCTGQECCRASTASGRASPCRWGPSSGRLGWQGRRWAAWKQRRHWGLHPACSNYIPQHRGRPEPKPSNRLLSAANTPQVLGEDLVLVQGQQDRMTRGADVWRNPVPYDKLGVRYRRWRNSGGWVGGRAVRMVGCGTPLAQLEMF